MKIAIVTPMALPLPAVKGGGAEWLIQTIIDENEKHHRFELTVIGVFDEQAKEKATEYKHTKFVFIPRDRLFYKYYGYLKKLLGDVEYFLPYNRFLKNFFAKNHFDKILLENNINLAAGLKKAGGEVIFHLHNDTVYPGAVLPAAHKRVDRVLCVSDFIKRRVLACGAFGTKPVDVLPNCCCMPVRPVEQSKQQLRDEQGIAQEEVVFLFAGRIIREKGVLELVQAFNMLDVSVRVKLLIVGGIKYSSNETNDYWQAVKAISGENVIYTGYVDYEEIGKYYACADVAVIPTLYVEEAASLAAIEAMTWGLPVIAADSGGIWDFVDESCGRKVPRGENFVSGLSNQMQLLAQDKLLRDELGGNGRARSDRFTPEMYYETFCDLIQP